jgi:CRP-like cAMP-binding protein
LVAHTQSFTRNELLAGLDADDFAALQPHFERVPMPRLKVLGNPGEPAEYVHFPEGGVVSVVANLPDGGRVEVGIVGREGFLGMEVLLGTGTTPFEVFVQVGDFTALRIAAAPFRAAVAERPALRDALLRFVHVFWMQTSHTAVSNARHSLEERLARWLLMCHDRVDGDELSLTHEFISQMLAVRRSGVTVTIHVLEGAGMLRATRGRLSIVNRSAIEELAGDAYGVPEREYRRLIGPFGRDRLATAA